MTTFHHAKSELYYDPIIQILATPEDLVNAGADVNAEDRGCNNGRSVYAFMGQREIETRALID